MGRSIYIHWTKEVLFATTWGGIQGLRGWWEARPWKRSVKRNE